MIYNWNKYLEARKDPNRQKEIVDAYQKIVKTISTMDSLKQENTVRNFIKRFDDEFGMSEAGAYRIDVHKRTSELKLLLKDKIEELKN